VFCSEVVGMLREKEDMISQLRDVALQTLGVRRQALRRLRIEEQEDMVYRVKEVSTVDTCPVVIVDIYIYNVWNAVGTRMVERIR
jgi:hypothetical protein